MLPILEDTRLAQRWSEGRISIDALLSYSAVCGTGSIRFRCRGTSARAAFAHHRGHGQPGGEVAQAALGRDYFPCLAKAWGEMTEFDDPFLVNAKLQPLDSK